MIYGPKTRVLLQVKFNGGLESHNIRIRAKPRYDTPADRRDERIATEFFSRVDVGKVDFDGRNVDRRDGIPQGYARMGVPSRVENYKGVLAKRLLNESYEFAFDVRLPALNLDPHAQSPMVDLFVNLS